MAASPIGFAGKRVMYQLSSPKCARLTATLASPPPKVAPSTGDWKNRSKPGGLSRSMISPKVTTFGSDATKISSSAAFDAGDDSARMLGQDVKSLGGNRRRVEQ